MKDAIGLLLFGLLLRHGSADVSHLGNGVRNNQYLPPPIQNLPIEQDNNGLDSQSNNAAGYLPPLNGLRTANGGYLPPYQSNLQHRNPDDHWSQRQYKDTYNPSVQVSYHNDYAIRGPQNDQVESDQQDDQSEEQKDDDSYEDHVEIDQQQLEPIFPSNFPVQAYLPPKAVPQNNIPSQSQPIVRPSRGEGISMVPYQHNNLHRSTPRPFSSPPREENPTPLSPVAGTHQQVQAPPHNGYEYLPPAQPADSLYPNQGLRVTQRPDIINEHQQGRLNGYLPPNPLESNQLNPSDSALEQDYLPPTQSTYDNNLGSQQDYLPPNRGVIPEKNLNQEVSQRGYLPPDNQDLNQYYLPPSPWNHNSQSDQNSPLVNDQQESQREDYLPPLQTNSGTQLNRRPKTRSQLEGTRVTNGLNEIRQPQQQIQQNYLPPLNALNNSKETPRNQLTVRGHVNVPLPIPQVGYFFIPGVVTEVPSLNEAKSETLRPALNIPTVVRPQLPSPQPTQRIATPEYTRSFQLQKPNRVPEQKSSGYVITPSIETLQNSLSEGLHAIHDQPQSVSPQTPIHQTGGPRQQSQRHTLVNFNPQGQRYLPPPNQNRPLNQQLQQQAYIPPDKLSNPDTETSEEIEEQDQPFIPNMFSGGAYLPPNNDHFSQQQNQDVNPQQHDQPHDHQQTITNNGRSYLPPVKPESINQITSLQSYMNQIHPNDRYGSSLYPQPPPPHEKGNPPPPAPAMFKKPSATRAYAPDMAYEAPAEDLHQDSPSKDSAAFPLEELFGLQENEEIDEPQLVAEKQRGHVRTVQIINSHTNTVRNIKVLETADKSGVKTFKILGHSSEDPMGDHRVVRIISKGPHPDGILQTVKIFNDHKEVELPTQNAYLPPPKAKETYIRVLRGSQEAYRSH